jgi:cell division protein FtsW
LTQALIAIGRGEWFGVGLGASVQKLFYLPEAHTDFLFSVLAEELGLAGAAVVIIAFGFITWRAIIIGRNAEAAGQMFGAYLAYGLGLLVGLQAYVNIGVNLGLLPTKGLTLPLMSYGGSSLVASAIAVALVLRVDYETRALK